MLRAVETVKAALQDAVSAQTDYGCGCAMGAGLAGLVIQEIERTQTPSLLAWLARDIACATAPGLSVGFFAEIGARAALLRYDHADDLRSDGRVVEMKGDVRAAPVGGHEARHHKDTQQDPPVF